MWTLFRCRREHETSITKDFIFLEMENLFELEATEQTERNRSI